MKLTPEMKAATKVVADTIRAAGFNVMSFGYTSVVVRHDNGKTMTVVQAKEAAEFIRTAAR